MLNNPKISVVMTVFNGAQFIKEAINSILNQTFSDFEFIIIDNASADGTKEIISSYGDPRIVFIENKENLGQTKALNVGIKHARGEFIARMDADDISTPERLQLQYRHLLQNPSIAVVGSWHEEIDEKGKRLKYFRMPLNPLEIKYYLISPGELGYYCVSHPTVLMRRKPLLEVGCYNEDCLVQDYDLWLRISRRYRIANLGKFLLKHRIFPVQQTRSLRKEIDIDCQRIIASNVLYYLPELASQDLTSLVRMLQYKPQVSKEYGAQVLNTLERLFEEYIDADENSALARKIQNKIILFYLLQLVKTNFSYSLKKFIKICCNNPLILFNYKFYRKMAKVMINN